MTQSCGVTSETGRLETVLLHRPGAELSRLTPRNNDTLLFDGIPWVGRAQQEHDVFAEVLSDHGVEVLYLAELLRETLQDGVARHIGIDDTVADLRLGATLRSYLKDRLADLSGEDLAEAMMAGLRNDEAGPVRTLVTALMQPEEFLIDPLPNLLFTRDSSAWMGDRPVLTSLAMPARRRESTILRLIYTHHPRFAGVRPIHDPSFEHVEGGDILLLGNGAVAVGVGQRTTPAGVERLANTAFVAGLARTVLAVPIDQQRATMHLDTICTMVDADAMVMYPNVAHRMQAYTVTPGADGVPLVSEPRPFLDAAAEAMGIDEVRLIDTGLDPVTAEREQWDDGNNTLAVAPMLCLAYERNVQTNSRLEAEGIEVLRIGGSELGSGRGGPRCMSCPISRQPLPGS